MNSFINIFSFYFASIIQDFEFLISNNNKNKKFLKIFVFILHNSEYICMYNYINLNLNLLLFLSYVRGLVVEHARHHTPDIIVVSYIISSFDSILTVKKKQTIFSEIFNKFSIFNHPDVSSLS